MFIDSFEKVNGELIRCTEAFYRSAHGVIAMWSDYYQFYQVYPFKHDEAVPSKTEYREACWNLISRLRWSGLWY